MNPRLIHRFVVGLVGLGALALLVPSLALAGARPDDRSGPLGATPATSPIASSDDVFMRAYARRISAPSTANAIRPDNRSGSLGVGTVNAGFSASDDVFMRAYTRHNADTSTANAIRPDDRSGPLGAKPITIASHSVAASMSATSVSNDGFQWWDAGIGAASVFGICALLLGTVTLQRQHRRGAVAH